MENWLASKLLALGHLLFASYMFLGWIAIVAGGLAGARFASNFWFRLTHAIGFAAVLVVSLFFRACPLTVLEYDLLARAGGEVQERQAFLVRLLSATLYPELPSVFLFWTTLTLGFSTFGLWWLIPPRRRESIVDPD
jgi:hypothetical protein